ncbi:helix-turn-helix domain-containing protein [Clostridium tagluense]|uniref:helix-turn-helix domain-containing protein n=1 Tax=Clostridium tagluense TaxID=360422 RepID=UPI001C0C5E97|nr:helix-turn-helix transcriptional regulator [Clostridium tagluense]MBU3126781.1 helix-turn-helix domain-containing protein [Clostridium tagluense]
MIGDNIRKALEKKGITSNVLAERIGVSATYISYLLNNKRTASLETLQKIAEALNVSLSDLTVDIDFEIQQTTTVNESESTYGIDEDMKAIIEALKNASPNKKAKVLKMIELFDDEN